MEKETLWGYIDQLEALAQSILDLTAEMHVDTGPRVPVTRAPEIGGVVQ